MKSNRYEKKSVGNKGIGLFISLLLTVIMFVVLVVFSNAITRSDDRVSVVVAIKDVPESTVVTKDNVKEYFKVIKASEDVVYQSTYGSLSELFNGRDELYLTDNVRKGEMVSSDGIVALNSVIGGFETPVEIGIKAKTFADAAGGVLRRGDTVDMCIVDKYGEEQSITLFILKAFSSEGTRIETDDTESVAVAFTVLCERADYATVADIASSGDFDLIKLNDVR